MIAPVAILGVVIAYLGVGLVAMALYADQDGHTPKLIVAWPLQLIAEGAVLVMVWLLIREIPSEE